MTARYTPDGIRITNRCHQCVEEGLKSKFVVKTAKKATNELTERYYDEEGEYHFHDPVRTGMWSCSNGHTGIYNKYQFCSVRNCEYRTVNL